MSFKTDDTITVTQNFQIPDDWLANPFGVLAEIVVPCDGVITGMRVLQGATGGVIAIDIQPDEEPD